ncbi:MAG TPA: sigma 54 modulation/S30EA ribosomal C-terminal domain-containing protein [Candidatus Limnocylindrales bacterium]|nr:sigma 54 modulation/S30EA ribosomal C-terminal domain-containing protein [Candidatus Limnocylindrales bacterium]
MTATVAAGRLEVIMRGRLPFRAREYALSKIMELVRHAPQAITAARVMLSRTFEGVVVEARLEAAGRLVRVQVAAQTVREGVDVAQDRLRRKLRRLGRHRGSGAEQAILDMDLMDYDFRLFVDALSGVDSVIYRDGFSGYRISRLDGNAAPTNASVPVPVDPGKAPRLTLQEAADALNAGSSAFLFFANADTGRGNVLYRRQDGHYALVTP